MNYMPLHLGNLGEKTKKSSQNARDHCSKRKELSDDKFVCTSPHNTLLEEDSSTRSSTESRLSFSDSCAHHPLAASRALECWPPWGSHFPSKRRTLMHRRPYPANGLPCFLLSSNPFERKSFLEDDALVKYRPLSRTGEIGLEEMLIQPIGSAVTAQESQASSLLCDNKEPPQSGALITNFVREESLDIHGRCQSSKPRVKEKSKSSARSIGAYYKNSAKSWVPNKTLLEKFPYNKHDVLQSCHSPLVFLELKDIINFDQYKTLFSKQEQQQLVKHVSPADTMDESLNCMFSSAQFESALRGFQALLSEGMFNSLTPGISPGVLQHYQQLLSLSNLTTSGWMESFSQLLCSGRRNGATKYAKVKSKEDSAEKLRSLNALSADVVSSSIDLMERTNASCKGKKTAIEKDYPQCALAARRLDYLRHEPATYRPKHYAKWSSMDKRRGNWLKPNDKNVHNSSKGRKSFANQGMLIETPFYGVPDHEILLDLPSSLSFQQVELLQKPVNRESPSQEAGNVVCQSKTPNDTLSQNTQAL